MKTISARLLRILSDPVRLIRYSKWTLERRIPDAVRRLRQKRKERRRPRSFVAGINSGPDRKRALVTYFASPFLTHFDQALARTHANYSKALIITRELVKAGYEVDVTDYLNTKFPKDENYDLILGQGPAFRRACRSSRKRTPRIFLAWGYPIRYNVRAVSMRRKELFREKRILLNASYPLELDSANYSTEIFCIGSKDVLREHERMFRRKVAYLPNIATTGVRNTTRYRVFPDCQRNFLWMAAYGCLHRGLDLLLDYFEANPQLHLWVCGGLRESDKHFFHHFQTKLLNLPNIHYEGWTDVTTEKFAEITRRCSTLLYPSLADGIPGSVINCMAAGILPAVTESSGIDIGDFGLKIQNHSVNSIAETIGKVLSMPPKEIERRSIAAANEVMTRYTEESFQLHFRNNLLSIESG